MEVLFFLFWAFFMILIFGLVIFSMVIWVMCLIEVVGYPEPVWRAAGQDKVVWVLVIVLAGGLGALIYWFSARPSMRAAQAALATPPAPGGTPPPVA